MSELFDDITRVVAAPVSRRQALKLIAGTVGAVLLSRFLGKPRLAMAIECDDELYPYECADICCRYDYVCASTVLLNGGGTYGICCEQWVDHLCSTGDYGWCCDVDKLCGSEPFTCSECVEGYEACGDFCCDTAAGQFCCDPVHNLCCEAGVECCYDLSGNGTCCPDGTRCVPEHPWGHLPRPNVCCPEDQACKGQCCPDGESCFADLMCCPTDRVTPERDGCCPSGFLYHLPTASCCLEGIYCGEVCCTAPGMVCRDGICQECPSGQTLCFDKCCAPGTCCFGKCCGDGQTCTGECTTLETITETIHPWNGGALNSSDGGLAITFMGVGSEETVEYTSQAQPGHPLPENAQLLRSFMLTSPSAGSQPQQVEVVFYTMHVRYTEATLAAMGVQSEFQLRFLWWDPSSSAWAPVFFELDRPAGEVVVIQSLLGEFALVAGEESLFGNTVYIPLVIK